jgi:hypothetical protein
VRDTGVRVNEDEDNKDSKENFNEEIALPVYNERERTMGTGPFRN